jgi:hypothetical protein
MAENLEEVVKGEGAVVVRVVLVEALPEDRKEVGAVCGQVRYHLLMHLPVGSDLSAHIPEHLLDEPADLHRQRPISPVLPCQPLEHLLTKFSAERRVQAEEHLTQGLL